MPTSLTRRLTLLMGVRGTRAVNASVNSVGKTVRATAAAVSRASKIMVGALALVGFAAFRMAAKFDSAMTKSTAIMGDLSQAMRNDMANAAREVALVTQFSAEQAAESFFFLASAGLDAASSIAALPTVAAFAQAGMFDMALATDLLTDAQSALGLTMRNDVVKNMENMIRVSDVLVKANTLANATVQQFSEALTTEAGAALKSFNIDVEEGVAVLAVFADQGIKASLAGSSLSRVLRLMTAAAVKNEQAYRKLDIQVFDISGNIRNMAAIVQDLTLALGNMDDESRVVALSQLGFKARVQGVILPLLGTAEAIRRYEKELRKAAGTTEDIAEKQLRSFSGRLGLLKSQIGDVAISLGNKLLPAGFALVEFLRNVIPRTVRWIKENENLVISIGLVVTAFAAFSLLTNPFVLIIAGIVGANFALNKFGDEINTFLNNALKGFKILAVNVEFTWSKLISELNALINSFDTGLQAALLAATGNVAGGVQALLFRESLAEDAKREIDAMVQARQHLIQRIVSDNEDIVGGFFSNVTSNFDEFADTITDKIANTFKNLLRPSTEAFEKSVAAIRKGAGTATPAIVGITSLPEQLGTLPSEPLAPIISEFDIAIAQAQTFAEAIENLARAFRDEFGPAASIAFRGAVGAGAAYFNTIEAMSKSFFKGESDRIIDFGLLTQQMWSGALAAALDAIAGELKAQAAKWALEGAALIAKGIGLTNPFSAITSGIKLLALAATAGAGAAALSGAAGAIRENAREQLAVATGQQAPLTPEQQAAGVVRTDGSRTGSLTRTGVVTQAQPQNVTFAPSVTFDNHDGGILVIGTGGIEEAGEIMGDLIIRQIQEAKRGGDL